MKRLVLTIIGFVTGIVAYAQNEFAADVHDANNQPVPGAYIHVVADPSINNGYYFSERVVTNEMGSGGSVFPQSMPAGTILYFITRDCGVMDTMTLTFHGIPMLGLEFTVCGTDKYIWGRVFDDTTVFVQSYDYVTYLIAKHWDANLFTYILSALDSSNVDYYGHYSLAVPDTYDGELMVKGALLPASSNYNNYLPTYYSAAVNWSGADIIDTSVNIRRDIYLIQGNNLGGPGFISGDVLQGANKSTAVGDPLSSRILILADATNHPVAYTYSDGNGAFSFTNLAYGTYQLYGDAPGKNNPALGFTLDANTPSFTQIVFQENIQNFWGSLWPLSVITEEETPQLKVYPNPAVDIITVHGLNAIAGNKTVVLSKIDGGEVFNRNYSAESNASISISDLPRGLYMLSVVSESGRYMYKVVK